MIPYDDLVAALSAWRARQGLPVSTMGGGSGPTPSPGSGPHGAPGSGPHGAGSSRPGMAAAVDDAMEVDETAMLDEVTYDSGNDGEAPERPTETDMGHGGREDW